MNTRIIELVVDENYDEFGGIEGVALVSRPAHEENWLAFNDDKQIFEVLTDEMMGELGRAMGELGEPAGQLEEEGFELVSITPITKKEMFGVGDYAQPNQQSVIDTEQFRYRYKYIGPKDEKNRTFCGEMMSANRVYRREDIDNMTNEIANSQFGYYDIFALRGSYNCRHFWAELKYQKTGTIINKSSVRKGVVGEKVSNQSETLTGPTKKAWEKKGETGKIERYNPKRFAEDSFTDYPQYMTDAAQAALDFIEKSGNPNDCMTQVGKVRAQQLAQRKPISLETITRMKSYISRHMVDLETSKDFETGCGKLAMSSWGCRSKEECNAALGWLDRKIGSMEMALEDACWPGYEAIGVKELDGRTVPNCVPIKMEASKISIDFDDTLTEKRGQEMAKRFIEEGYDVYVISARSDKKSMLPLTDKLLIPRDKVYATGSNKAKIELVKKLEIDTHIDNNPDVIKALEGVGEQFDIVVSAPAYVDEVGKKKKKPLIVEPVAESKLKFSIDDEKRQITGAAIVPNKFIIRHSATGPYYVFFSVETTKFLAEKFMKNKLTDSTNIEHTDKSADAFVMESWIVEDPENDKSNALGLTYPQGTWVITMKVQSDKLWKEIKDGKYKGYSVEGWFNEKAIFNSSNSIKLDTFSIRTEKKLLK